MGTLSSAMQAALAADGLMPFIAVRLTLPTVTLALLDGSAVVTFAGSTFVGEDPSYGVLAGVEDLSDGGEDTAPRARITLNPKDLSALTTLAAASNQGSKVEIWEGLIDLATGLPVADPDLAFEGEYDQPVWAPVSMSLTIDCGSVFEKFFENDEGARLTDSFHQSIWPGETGFQYVFETEDRALPWGSADKARPVAVRAVLPRSSLFDYRD
jgi:hypothetical protein